MLAILVAFMPKRRTLPQIAALAAAVIIMAQLTADHWFYLYIVWFFPALLVALAGLRTHYATAQVEASVPSPSSPCRNHTSHTFHPVSRSLSSTRAPWSG